jgi:hypothetical protein
MLVLARGQTAVATARRLHRVTTTFSCLKTARDQVRARKHHEHLTRAVPAAASSAGQ